MPNAFETTFQQRVIPAANRGFGVEVTLSRGVQTSEPFTARRNDREHKAIGHEIGLEISIMMRDFYVPVTVMIDGQQIEPRTGDRITEGSEVFEISPPDNDKPPVELQAGGYEYIVHTKRVQ
jgi:hypothetical protein